MIEACPHTVSAGTYLLGMLTDEETNEFRRHSATCVHCMWEIVELMPGALFLEELKAKKRAANRRVCWSGGIPSVTSGPRTGSGCCRG